MGVIVIDNLTKCYGRRVGVERLSLSVPQGSIFGFLGPNGAGKTTAIRVLLALLRPTSGNATIFGRDCWRDSHRIKRDIGYVPGDLRLHAWMTARSALRVFGEVRGRDLTNPGQALIEQLDLEPGVRVRNMSRGMRQKLGLILALVHDPKLLILDEPTSALDPLMQQALYDELRCRAAAGTTIFFSSHTLSEVEVLCDRVAILRKGRLVADETLEGLRTRAKREVILRWKPDAEVDGLAAPAFLDVKRRYPREWRCVLDGPAAELIKWASVQPLDDLTIGQPELETVFQAYYEDEAGGAA
ncbi:MAG: ABC transporter ATP-binding protein [Phycisphaerae bacterium]|jgi:ABC-2 type transport system ATP-binding protein